MTCSDDILPLFFLSYARTTLAGPNPQLQEPDRKVITFFNGRCRMALLEDGSAESLLPFVTDHVTPASAVITDAWMGYHGLAGLGYAHQRRSHRAARARGEDPAALRPAVRRCRFAGQAVAAEHSPGGGRARPPAELPR